MINYKKVKNLSATEKWPKIASVFIKGIPGETDTTTDVPQKQDLSQTWSSVAVFKATSNEPTKFYVGFTNLGIIKYLEYEFTTNLEFGMRIGGGDVRVFVLPKDLTKKLKLKMVEITKEDDPKYRELILI